MFWSIALGLLAWVAVGYLIVMISSNIKEVSKYGIRFWKWYHWFLAITVWPWFLVELIYAEYKGYL